MQLVNKSIVFAPDVHDICAKHSELHAPRKLRLARTTRKLEQIFPL